MSLNLEQMTMDILSKLGMEIKPVQFMAQHPFSVVKSFQLQRAKLGKFLKYRKYCVSWLT